MTVRYAEVIGDPISHSKSPLIHTFWLEKLDLAMAYRACHVTPDALAGYVANRSADPDWLGCNVTIPHKIAVMDYVADPGDVRTGIGAMNTLFRDEDSRVIGTNTDASGFYMPIADLSLGGETVIVIGTGGAAHAILFALSKCNVQQVVLLARNALKGAALLVRFGLKGKVLPLNALLPRAKLMVNASPLGMIGHELMTFDLSPLPSDAIVYDIVYTPLTTPLLAAAEARGLETIDGLEMLVGQAAAAFELFFGEPAPREHDAELRERLIT